MIRLSYIYLQYSEIGELSMHEEETLFEEPEESDHDLSKGTGIWSFCYHAVYTFQVTSISGCTMLENCDQLCTDS